MLDKIAIMYVWFVVLMLLIRLVKVDNIHFKSGWVASIFAVIITLISIVISIFI